MRILIADDDDVSRIRLKSMLMKRGHEVISTTAGNEAWKALQAPDAPRMAILDWMMPGLDGPEVCRRVRTSAALKALYLILLTSQAGKQHLLEGLGAGANDFVTKPFDPEELEARVNVGIQVVGLQSELSRRVRELEDALARVNQLQGLLPICSYCKSIRDDQDYWHRVENYICDHSGAQFSHGICPECWKKVVEPELVNQGLAIPQEVGGG